MSYVYRLVVEYPEIDHHHPPDEWVCDMQDWGREGEWFSWPQERRFLSRRAAQNRADRLIRYGCTVTIQRAPTGQWENIE